MIRNLLVVMLLATTVLRAQQRPTGEIFDPEIYNALPLKAPVSTRSILPPRVSLEKYCPTPGDQGEFMTCAAWSSAYHFRTIIEAAQRNITDRAEIDKMVYSPTWVYEILKEENDNDCAKGLATARSLLVFKEVGVPSYSTLPFSCLSGTQKERFTRLDPMVDEAAKARIRDLQILFLAKEGVDPQEKIRAIKKVLAEGYPVLVSHTLYDSFHGAKDVWRTLPHEATASDRHGSHAMVIVGYDDERYGGAFRYLNSWGPKWGDGGFVWVPYATTGELCYGAYQAFPFALETPVVAAEVPTPAPTPSVSVPTPAPPPPPPAPVAKAAPAGRINLELRDGTPMPVTRISTRNLIIEDDTPDQNFSERSAYRMTQAYPSGTRFRFYLQSENEGYLYAFATDLSGKVNKIFPYADNVSPLIGKNTVIAFPADDKVVRLDNNPGTDYLLVLYSQRPLDLAKLWTEFNRSNEGLTAKMQAALGEALVAEKDIIYTSGELGFRLRDGAPGTIVPLMIEIDHR